jgi:hypothetical protein
MPMSWKYNFSFTQSSFWTSCNIEFLWKMTDSLKIGFLGGGKMAQAMAKGFITAGK